MIESVRAASGRAPDTALVRLRCSVCWAPIVDLKCVLHACAHPAHETCLDGECARCRGPPPSLLQTYAVAPALWVVGGPLGLHALAVGEYRRAVMHASTFGLFTLASMLPVRQPLWYSDAAFAASVAVLYGWTWWGRLLAPGVSFWVSGAATCGLEPAALDLAATAVCMGALAWVHETHPFADAVLIMACAARRLWTWPTIWDVHCGNCCGLWSMLVFVSLVTLSPSVLLGFSGEHRAFVVCYLASTQFLARQTRDPFTKDFAYAFVACALLVFLRAFLATLDA